MSQVDTTNSVFVNDDDIYNKPIKAIPVPERKRDIDTTDSLYSNIIAAGLSSQLDLNALNSLNTNAESRNQLYNIYDVMCEDGSIGAVVETYAEDATETNDRGNIVWVTSSDPKVTQFIEYLLDTLNIDKNIFKWTYSLCKYGDLYLRLYRNSEYKDDLFDEEEEKGTQVLNESLETNDLEKQQLEEDIKIKAYSNDDPYVHYMEMVSNPAEMFELTKFGKTVGYVKAPVTSTITKQENTIFNTFKYRFNKDDITLYPATQFVHASLEDNINREEELVDIFIDINDYNNNDESKARSYKVRRGQSLLSNVYKVWRQLNLLESSVLLNRVTKSSIIRLINVEVGDMAKADVTKTLMSIKSMIEQKVALNQDTSMSEYNSAGPVENNIYVPTHNGTGAITTTQIGGDVDVKSLADLDYYMNKLYGQLRVPKQYFSQTDDSTGFNGGSSLSIISSRYAKMIKRIQNTMIQALTDAINLMLLDKKLDGYVNQFTLHMLTPTTQEEIDRRDNLSSKVQLTSDIMNMLADIEDPVIKLKILKSLLSGVIDDNEIVELLQEEIERLQKEVEEEITTESDLDDQFDSDTPMDFNSTFGDSDIGSEETIDIDGNEESEESEESTEQILPSPEDIGVDLTNSEEA